MENDRYKRGVLPTPSIAGIPAIITACGLIVTAMQPLPIRLINSVTNGRRGVLDLSGIERAQQRAGRTEWEIPRLSSARRWKLVLELNR